MRESVRREIERGKIEVWRVSERWREGWRVSERWLEAWRVSERWREGKRDGE